MTIDTVIALVETIAVLYLVLLERRVLDVETRNADAFDAYFKLRRAWYEARMRKLAADNASKLVQHGDNNSQREAVQPVCADDSPPLTAVRDQAPLDQPAQPADGDRDGD